MMLTASKLFLLSHAITLVAIATQAQPRQLQASDLIGTYTHSAAFAGSSVTIEPAGKFHIDVSDCTQEYYYGGTYAFRNGVLILTTTKETVKGHGETDDQAKNLLDAKVFREMYHEDPPTERKNDELVPIQWGERLYLIEKEELSEFCNAINLGLEPRNDLRSNGYLGSFYLRNGDQNKSASGHPALTSDLLGLLLTKPVESTIKSILREDDVDIAVIDKGSEVGLKPGMRMIVTEQDSWDGPDLWTGLVVVSAEPNFAKLKVLGRANVGDKVSSKFVDRRFQ